LLVFLPMGKQYAVASDYATGNQNNPTNGSALTERATSRTIAACIASYHSGELKARAPGAGLT
jgi:hypothetical protein